MNEHRASSIEWARALLAGDFVVLDTETTGSNRDRDDEPVALAVTAPDGTVLIDTLINPRMSIDAGAAAVHGITEAMVAAAPSWWDIRAQLFDAIRGKVVVIYNASFHQMILRNADASAGEDDMPYVTEIPAAWKCAMQQYAIFYGDWNDYYQSYRWQRLTAACRQQDIEVEAKPHSALGDCLRTLGLIKAMAAQASTEDSAG